MFSLNPTCPRGDKDCPCVTPPAPVVDALTNACLTFTGEIRWDHLAGCYLGNVRGITVGIERDGYIHS